MKYQTEKDRENEKYLVQYLQNNCGAKGKFFKSGNDFEHWDYFYTSPKTTCLFEFKTYPTKHYNEHEFALADYSKIIHLYSQPLPVWLVIRWKGSETVGMTDLKKPDKIDLFTRRDRNITKVTAFYKAKNFKII